MTVVKLPLAVRKNVRDEFEAKLPEFNEALSKLLKADWTYNFDVPTIWSRTTEDNSYPHARTGSMMADYVGSIVWAFDSFIRSYGDTGIEALNNAAHKHSVTLVQDDNKRFSYCGVTVEEGEMRILYAPGNEGVNSSDCLSKLADAIDEAEKARSDPPRLPFKARSSIEKEWTPKVEELTKAFATLLAFDKVTLEPGFEEIYKTMSSAKKVSNDRWAETMGQVAFDYFESLKGNLSAFKDDDMMQEGFQEAITTGKIGFRIVEKLVKKSYAECVIEDEKLFIQTKPDTWWVNTYDVGTDVIDLL